MRFHDRPSVGMAAIIVSLALPVTSSTDAGSLAAIPDRQEPQGTGQLPDGVTEAKIALGETLFSGEASCGACHGADAKGIPGMTTDLTDGEWLYTEEGTYEALVRVTKNGVPVETTGGMPMPPMGGQELTDEQVEALAAYMWSLNSETSD